ncbi:MAG: hypothetical protein NTW93_05685 [Phycisphaerae bacterium]|nr:hypothetical protein [Phycisphaerae bacterium]
MKNIKAKIIFLFVCVSVFAVCAEASLYNDSDAMADFKNKTSFSITMSGKTLKADVEYAVYSPGDYPGDDLTDGSEYIYAYQIFNSTQSNVATDFFSVGLIDSSYADYIYTDTTYGTPGGKDPFAFSFPQSAAYVFIGTSLNPGQWSDVLIFSSTHLPTIGFGTVSGGGLSGMGSLATPSVLPEPATILFIAPTIFILRIKKMTRVK